MKAYFYITILVLVSACVPQNKPTTPTHIQVDSVYTIADLRSYGDYYHSGHQVYALDLLSEGLEYDSAGYIIGSGSLIGIRETRHFKGVKTITEQEIAAATSKVIRDGHQIVVRSEELVPGDIVVLEAGDSVPADCRIIDCFSMKA